MSVREEALSVSYTQVLPANLYLVSFCVHMLFFFFRFRYFRCSDGAEGEKKKPIKTAVYHPVCLKKIFFFSPFVFLYYVLPPFTLSNWDLVSTSYLFSKGVFPFTKKKKKKKKKLSMKNDYK